MRTVLVVGVLLATGCGGGPAGSPAGGKAAYLGKAEAVCAAANRQLTSAKQALPTAVSAIPAYVHRIVAIAQQDVTALSALTPPAKDAADVSSRLLTPLRQQLSDGEAYARKVDAAAAANDAATLTGLVLNPPTKTRVDLPWMRAYGFRECVRAANTGAAAS